MAITYDSGSTYQAATANPSQSHTGGSGVNRLLVVGFNYRGNATPTSPTYGGQAMTIADSQQHGVVLNTSIWYIVNPLTGANTLACTIASANWVMRAHNLSGVKQTSPIRATTSDNSSSINPTAQVIALVSSPGDFCIDSIGTRKTTASSLTASGSQHQDHQVTQGSLISASSDLYSATGTTTAMAWTLDVADNWCQIAVSIIPWYEQLSPITGPPIPE